MKNSTVCSQPMFQLHTSRAERHPASSLKAAQQHSLGLSFAVALSLSGAGFLWSAYAWLRQTSGLSASGFDLASFPTLAVLFLSIASISLLARAGYRKYETNRRSLATTLEQLEQSEGRLQLALEAGEVGVWDWPDLSRRANWWDERTFRMLGYDPGEIEVTFDFFLSQLHPDDRDGIEQGVTECIASEPCHPVEYRLRTKGGDYRWFRAIGRVTFDAQGVATRLTGILQDIQERKEMEERLAQANRKLKFKTREMEQMIYVASHDLKSPLSSLVGLAHLMRDEENAEPQPNPQKLELISLMIQSGRHLAHFIDEIMDLSFLGKKSVRVETLKLSDMLEELRTDLASDIENAQCQLRVEGELPILRVNPVAIRQILQNLLGNAFKYGCSDGDKRVIVGAETKDHCLEIYVRDFGPGIPEQHQEAIFALFTRLDYEKPGSGVGLAIVEKAARLCGGSVRVESKPGAGARFTLSLPRSLVVVP